MEGGGGEYTLKVVYFLFSQFRPIDLFIVANRELESTLESSSSVKFETKEIFLKFLFSEELTKFKSFVKKKTRNNFEFLKTSNKK